MVQAVLQETIYDSGSKKSPRTRSSAPEIHTRSKTKSFNKTSRQVDATKLLGSKVHCMLYGGSRSGKTFIILRSIVVRALKAPKSRHLVLRFRFNAVRRAIWFDTFPKVMELCFPGVYYEQNKTDWFYRFSNGSEIWLGGLDDKERVEKILGNEYSTIFINEASEVSWDAVTTALTRLAQNVGLVNRMYYDCNPPAKRHWTFKAIVLGLNPETNVPIPNHDDYGYLLMNPTDNSDNLPPGYVSNILENLPARKRSRFLLGLFADDVEGALWSMDIINPHRVQHLPPHGMLRMGVGVDPAVTANPKQSNSTGIIGGGMHRNGCIYIVEDATCLAKPSVWAQETCDMYDRLKADRVIGEINNGGDLVETNLRTVDKDVSFMSVHASRGKVTRAEPIAALYEKGRVKHVGEFPELEDQLCSWNPDLLDQLGESPDRMDALVWLCKWLIGKRNKVGVW